MMTVAPLVVVIGLEQILVIQVMMPMKWDRQILVCSFVGAIVGVVLNLLLVKRMLANGSAFVWLVSELVVMSFALYFVTRGLAFRFPARYLGKEILLSVPMLAVLFFLERMIPGDAMLRLGILAVVAMSYFLPVHWSTIRPFLKNVRK